MLFDFGQDTTAGFWMKDTLLPLSIAHFATSGELVSVTDMEPCLASAACPSYTAPRPFRFAIEVPKGTLESLGIVPGARISIGGSACTPSTTRAG